MSNAREAVFASIRQALEGASSDGEPVERDGPSTSLGSPAALETRSARIENFTRLLEGVGGHVHRARDTAAAAKLVDSIAAELGAREVALSDSASVREVVAQSAGGFETFDGSRDRERLLACDLGVTSAQNGIAETGTLVLLSDTERHRLTSLVPPVHVALLDVDAIVGTLGDALAAARKGGLPPLVTCITGPSRTGDIELTIVVGVHGPKTLHVILLG